MSQKFLQFIEYLTWSQIPMETSIWHTLRKKTKSLEPLAYERIAIVFQPTARASPAHTKTNRRSAHRLEALEIWVFFSLCAKWMPPLESDFMLNIQWHEEIFETSRHHVLEKNLLFNCYLLCTYFCQYFGTEIQTPHSSRKTKCSTLNFYDLE